MHRDRCPKGRHGETGEMDGLCVYFASKCCSYTTGQTVAVDGGWTCT
ncbi:SDR family oxidoreductase [Adlercreutzia sp.]